MILLRHAAWGCVWLHALSCAEANPPADALTQSGIRGTSTNVEVAEFDVTENGIDRFLYCPPPGELGQDWIPPLPTWSSPPSTEGTEAQREGGVLPRPDEMPTLGRSRGATTEPSKRTDQPTSTDPRENVSPDVPSDVMHGPTPTEKAIADTREAFRACYNYGLIYDPTQDGHVAIVLRIGRDGRVAKVESWGACEIASPTIECMRDAAKKLRFRPPAGGSATVTIPAVFTSSSVVRRTSPRPNEVYAAAAYVAVEGIRQEFHACERSALESGGSVSATATFALDLDDRGKVLHANIDPWTGDKNLLACAAAAFGRMAFPPPPGGKGSVLVRLAFNPRAGSK
jgi:hypothetical protein